MCRVIPFHAGNYQICRLTFIELAPAGCDHSCECLAEIRLFEDLTILIRFAVPQKNTFRLREPGERAACAAEAAGERVPYRKALSREPMCGFGDLGPLERAILLEGIAEACYSPWNACSAMTVGG